MVKMIHGLFLDPRIWNTDYLSNPSWNPNKFGINIDLHKDAFAIPNVGVDKKYKFVLATEVWEIPMQKTLEFLRNKGLKIFLIPREMLPSNDFDAFFKCSKFKYKDNYYINPDVLLSPNDFYSTFWSGKTRIIDVGCSRYDVYNNLKFDNRDVICKRFKIDNKKKIILFALFPPYHYQIDDGGNIFYADLYNDLSESCEVVERFARENSEEFQVIAKLHPYAQKCYDKNVNGKKEIPKVIQKYYNNPTSYFKIIKDQRMNGTIARELLSVSELVMGFRTTMLLEAQFFNKPIINLMFKQCSEMTGMPGYVEKLFTVKNKDELYNTLSGKNFSQCHIKESGVIETYLGRIDGRFCEKTCDAIKENI